MPFQPQPEPEPEPEPQVGRFRDDSPFPEVKWGLPDLAVGVAVTILVVISILSFSGAVGTLAGFETSIPSSSGYLVGAISAALAILLTRITRSPIWPVVLILVLGVGIVSISYLLANDTGDGVAELAGVTVTIIAVTIMSASFAVIGIAHSVVRYREPFSALGFVRTSGYGPYVFATKMWLIGLGVLVAWVLGITWLGLDFLLPPDSAQQVLDDAGGKIFVTVLLVGVVGPVAEEIFFRGFILTGLLKRFGLRRALLFSSLLFGFFHFDPGAIVPTFVLGLMLGWVYLKTTSIWPAMFAHALHNTVVVLIARYAAPA